ncbi:MAG: hypothetical protein JWQ34_646 [Mucilaginibacter sp.]|jgi:hypothetical protein|uniref:DUF4294 domain-containing protein n=1 Tax=Mucilaginibacter sp. TaxID=1882438 RepID=UPI0026185608|nr:DUF4294 domain-containing protein [Mucilaginibacter sp.]MDB5002421.1 hypothetical protein [Mucilaginibacter sp.]
MKLFGLLIVFCCLVGTVKAQEQRPALPITGKNDTIKTYVTLLDGVMVPWVVVPDVTIRASRIFKTEADRRAFNLLRYNVSKVIPYAHFAGDRYRKLQRDLALTGDIDKQKALIQACNDEIKTMFKTKIEDLTISQGDILIKLVNRETDMTTYNMVKELKGWGSALLFQTIARVVGHNLKETYDRNEQRDIETILQEYGYDSYKSQ